MTRSGFLEPNINKSIEEIIKPIWGDYEKCCKRMKKCCFFAYIYNVTSDSYTMIVTDNYLDNKIYYNVKYQIDWSIVKPDS